MEKQKLFLLMALIATIISLIVPTQTVAAAELTVEEIIISMGYEGESEFADFWDITALSAFARLEPCPGAEPKCLRIQPLFENGSFRDFSFYNPTLEKIDGI